MRKQEWKKKTHTLSLSLCHFTWCDLEIHKKNTNKISLCLSLNFALQKLIARRKIKRKVLCFFPRPQNIILSTRWREKCARKPNEAAEEKKEIKTFRKTHIHNTTAARPTKRAKQRKLASRRELRSVYKKKEKKELAKNFRQISNWEIWFQLISKVILSLGLLSHKHSCWAHADYEHGRPGQVCGMLPVPKDNLSSWFTFCLMDSLVPNRCKIVNTPYPLFQWNWQSKDILLNRSMKCWNWAFNAQGSRLIIVIVQVGAVKIYVAAVEALRKRKDRMKLSLPPKFMVFWVSAPVES